jgi:hypothetical protein
VFGLNLNQPVRHIPAANASDRQSMQPAPMVAEVRGGVPKSFGPERLGGMREVLIDHSANTLPLRSSGVDTVRRLTKDGFGFAAGFIESDGTRIPPKGGEPLHPSQPIFHKIADTSGLLSGTKSWEFFVPDRLTGL